MIFLAFDVKFLIMDFQKNFEIIKVLDHGFIKIVDCMGNDDSIVNAARVSYGDGTKHVSQNVSLIRYLMRHKHTSPFEMCEIKLHIKMPIFIARQWFRHRTANVNEYSGRYSKMVNEFYFPKVQNFGLQSLINKQGQENVLDGNQAFDFVEKMKLTCQQSFNLYNDMIEKGVAREIARIILPINIYTEFYWKCDLHNLLNLIRLRSHKTAQFEIQEYSKALEMILEQWVPITYQAFKDYIKDSFSISAKMKKFLKRNELALDETEFGKSEIIDFENFWKE